MSWETDVLHASTTLHFAPQQINTLALLSSRAHVLPQRTAVVGRSLEALRQSAPADISAYSWRSLDDTLSPGRGGRGAGVPSANALSALPHVLAEEAAGTGSKIGRTSITSHCSCSTSCCISRTHGGLVCHTGVPLPDIPAAQLRMIQRDAPEGAETAAGGNPQRSEAHSVWAAMHLGAPAHGDQGDRLGASSELGGRPPVSRRHSRNPVSLPSPKWYPNNKGTTHTCILHTVAMAYYLHASPTLFALGCLCRPGGALGRSGLEAAPHPLRGRLQSPVAPQP